jgi:hypothetical protein
VLIVAAACILKIHMEVGEILEEEEEEETTGEDANGRD